MHESGATKRKFRRQIDAIVIVVSLFFLFIASLGEEWLFPSYALSFLVGINPQDLFALIITIIVTIFAFSAIAVCMLSELGVGRRFVLGGLVCLLFMIFLIAL